MNSTADYTVSFPGLGINNLGINRVIFQFSLFGRDIAIYWYGLLIALAFLLALLLAIRQAKKHDLKSDDIVDFFLILIPAAIIGARLYYVAFEWSQFSSDWRKIFDLRSGGLAFYGGVIGAIVCLKSSIIWLSIYLWAMLSVAGETFLIRRPSAQILTCPGV